tara:strand:+ start:204 stop:500 length:297 start_codon:yes stop_codon:yes gene_type:complete
MLEIRRTDVFGRWLDNLKDVRGRARILARLERLAEGHRGDTKPLREGISELRIDVGPGYRVYFTKRGRSLILLLCGGDKGTQKRDIERAIRLAQNLLE